MIHENKSGCLLFRLPSIDAVFHSLNIFVVLWTEYLKMSMVWLFENLLTYLYVGGFTRMLILLSQLVRRVAPRGEEEFSLVKKCEKMTFYQNFWIWERKKSILRMLGYSSPLTWEGSENGLKGIFGWEGHSGPHVNLAHSHIK